MPVQKTYGWNAADLAPGRDRESPSSVEGFVAHRVLAASSDDFQEGFSALWSEFGPKGEMEPEKIIRARLARGAGQPKSGFWTLYEMAVVRREGQFVAVRDVNAIVRRDMSRPIAVVHLSHVLIVPALRGTGLSAWLRALPLQTARRLIEASGAPKNTQIILAAEMEHPNEKDPARQARLRSYSKAGFLALSPDRLSYYQPDFRLPEEIDASGGKRPVPMRVVMRRVGHESEMSISREEAMGIVESLYGMFALDYRVTDIAPLWGTAKRELCMGLNSVELVDPLR